MHRSRRTRSHLSCVQTGTHLPLGVSRSTALSAHQSGATLGEWDASPTVRCSQGLQHVILSLIRMMVNDLFYRSSITVLVFHHAQHWTKFNNSPQAWTRESLLTAGKTWRETYKLKLCYGASLLLESANQNQIFQGCDSPFFSVDFSLNIILNGIKRSFGRNFC